MTDLQPNILTPVIEETLRPNELDSFIGQERLKQGLRIFIDAAKKRKEPLSHVLFYGPPGLGKTTLANILAKEMAVNCKVTSGAALQRVGDLASILSSLEPGDVLFIDEIHRLSHSVEEILYPAMEDYALDLILGKGPSAKTLRLDLPKFTLVGATTRIGNISSPMRDRFGLINQLEFYTVPDLEKILFRSAKILNIKIDPKSAHIIAKRSRLTPRVANRLLHRVRDYTQVKGGTIIDETFAKKALILLDIDELGLDTIDRKLLNVIHSKFAGGPVGIKTLASAINNDPHTLEEVIEPFLFQLGFLDRTPAGRKITKLAQAHLGLIHQMIL